VELDLIICGKQAFLADKALYFARLSKVVWFKFIKKYKNERR
jgi:hypothetical protein